MSQSEANTGLRGVSAGETTIATVGKEGTELSYRGYDIIELAEQSTFEEVAYLLIYGDLPNSRQLEQYKTRLKSYRGLPQTLKEVLERIPADSHPMDVMRTGCSMLGTLEQEENFNQQTDVADRLLAVFPSILLYWYHFTSNRNRIETETDDETIAGHFLHLLHGEKADKLQCRAMDVSLILYAEHEFNASTFTARVCASTLSDFYSAVAGAIGSLRGPLHGGANEAAMNLIECFTTPEEAILGVKNMLASKDKIMGFGHAIYRENDPRNMVIKSWAKKLSEKIGDKKLYAISEAIEKLMWNEKKLFPNLDFYSASIYHFLGIPTQLFTPIFVCSRVSGWAAHIIEQRDKNRLIRPSADYIGYASRPYVDINSRK
jgi:2-methylcitrate synthase